MDSTKILKASFLDILFDDRNKSYGAYELRSHYDRRVRNAIIATSSIVLVMIGGYVLNNRLMAAVDAPKLIVRTETKLEEVKLPDPDPIIPPPPVEAAPLPQVATRAFTNPVITSQEVQPEEAPPRQEELKHVAIGTADIDGIEDGIPAELGKGGNGTDVVTIEKGNTESDKPFGWVEIMPEFPGGEAALMKYLQKNTKFPSLALDNGIQGTVFVQFVVNRDGTITDVKTTGAQKGGGLEDEALRVVRSMPKWKPGRQNGQNVAVFFNLPINFKSE
ncbi:energy transducer TonB [Chitinophaga silvatica]|uniref:Energy transducer TonB n=1 Tax=Chitinophaga silvatica TaxID=2282649 RepID=A0A3E1Y872_9BACT|nr:energy transducer TonB [Chitinophaga silvatica]RFS21353.1 energy transducer TonB [Chitinophaga silvatica]